MGTQRVGVSGGSGDNDNFINTIIGGCTSFGLQLGPWHPVKLRADPSTTRYHLPRRPAGSISIRVV